MMYKNNIIITCIVAQAILSRRARVKAPSAWRRSGEQHGGARREIIVSAHIENENIGNRVMLPMKAKCGIFAQLSSSKHVGESTAERALSERESRALAKSLHV